MELRRRLIVGAATAAAFVCWPRLALCDDRCWILGVLLTPGATADRDAAAIMRAALERRGLVEGKHYVFALRFSGGDAQYLQAAKELVSMGVDMIVTMGGSPSVKAALEATKTIPIVMMSSADPVGDGFINSLAHPGGNVTGNCIFGVELAVKRLQLLVQALASPSAVAYLATNLGGFTKRDEQYDVALAQAASSMSIRMEFVKLRSFAELADAFAEIKQRNVDAVVLNNSAEFLGIRKLLAELALQHRLPAICDTRTFAEAGLMMSYGADLAYVLDKTADYIARIYRGAAPRDLPVELVLKFDLAVNTKTAAALGITFPKSLMLMANRVYA
ncbi:ABC transporter substrate-binding protein [Variovorax sp. YR216]|uniref:ABC transporter substrate-binding protein n=1 Tax=Variovorax sp. YR216 TaxID=1882828 RepID=UPI00089584C1|nr:ABC transporter substrate-binding protein [Variovorax sp. YR216]SEB06158.1 putative ABC transport system substrate-binding protein [Variovorax sp. YR216]